MILLSPSLYTIVLLYIVIMVIFTSTTMMLFVIVAMVIDGSGCGYLLSSLVGLWVKYTVVHFTPLASWRVGEGKDGVKKRNMQWLMPTPMKLHAL